jgi:hypothetical protein
VAQFQRDYIKAFLFQAMRAGWLRSTTTVRTDAECIHVDPVAPDAFGEIIGIISVGVFHRRTIDDFPLHDFGSVSSLTRPKIAEHQAGAQR